MNKHSFFSKLCQSPIPRRAAVLLVVLMGLTACKKDEGSKSEASSDHTGSGRDARTAPEGAKAPPVPHLLAPDTPLPISKELCRGKAPCWAGQDSIVYSIPIGNMFIPETYGKISFASKSGGTNPVAGEIDDYKYGEYAPDGNHLLVEDLRGSVDSMTGQSSNVKLTLYLCDPSGGKEVLLSQKDTKVYARFARDGQSIVYVKGRQLATMELKTRTEKVYNIPDESHGAMSPVLSLDNSRIYYLCSQKGACDVWMLNIATGTNMQITTGMRTVGAYAIEGKSLTPLPDHLDISPDGLFLAVSARVGITGDVADQLVTKDGNPTMPAYHDSSLGNIWLLTVDGKVKKQITNGDHDQRPRFSPDGKQLAFQRKVKPQPGQQQISFGGEPVGLWRVMLIDLGR